MSQHKIIICGKEIELSEEEYRSFINSKPNIEFLEQCKKVWKLFNKDINSSQEEIK